MSCTNCPYKGRFIPLQPRELKQKPLMVIAEAPTPSEVRSGRYFSRPGAKTAINSMKEAGFPIDEEQVHYTYALGCGFDAASLKKCSVEALRSCHNRINEEIKQVKPQMILTLGAKAAKTVTGDMSLKVKETQGLVRTIGVEGTLMVNLVSPASFMRSPAGYKPFQRAMKYAADVYNGKDPDEPQETEWMLMEKSEHVEWLANKLRQQKWVSVDLETTSLNRYDFGDGTEKVLTAGFCFEAGKAFVLPDNMTHHLPTLLSVDNVQYIWQNGKYDVGLSHHMAAGFDPLLWNARVDHDTMLMHYTLNEQGQHGLGMMAATYLGVDEYKSKLNKQFREGLAFEIPREALYERVAVDADYTFQLAEVLYAEIEKDKRLMMAYHGLSIPYSGLCMRVEHNGFLADTEYLHSLIPKYEESIQKLKEVIIHEASPFWDPAMYKEATGAKSAPEIFNPSSPKQLAYILYDCLGMRPRVRKGRSTGAPVLDSVDFEDPRNEACKDIIKAIREYRSVVKENSTYIAGTLKYVNRDGRVRCNFKVQGTATGRLSCSEPNLQNVPSAHAIHNIRQGYVAPPGKVIMEIDYSGAELRVLAHMSQCPDLMGVFQDPTRNLHDEVVEEIYGPSWTKQQRMRAKAVSFGIMFGREYASFMDEFDIAKQEALEMIAGWKRKYPQAWAYLQECRDAVKEGRTLMSPLGRFRRPGLVNKNTLGPLQNEFMNFNIQGPSSDMLMNSALDVEQWIQSRFTPNTDSLDKAMHIAPVKIVNLVHDSMVLECIDDPAVVQEVCQAVGEIMVSMPKRLLNSQVPFQVDYDIGLNWGNLSAYDPRTETVNGKYYGDWLKEMRANA